MILPLVLSEFLHTQLFSLPRVPRFVLFKMGNSKKLIFRHFVVRLSAQRFFSLRGMDCPEKRQKSRFLSSIPLWKEFLTKFWFFGGGSQNFLLWQKSRWFPGFPPARFSGIPLKSNLALVSFSELSICVPSKYSIWAYGTWTQHWYFWHRKVRGNAKFGSMWNLSASYHIWCRKTLKTWRSEEVAGGGTWRLTADWQAARKAPSTYI